LISSQLHKTHSLLFAISFLSYYLF
jgi:hypothetical protein